MIGSHKKICHFKAFTLDLWVMICKFYLYSLFSYEVSPKILSHIHSVYLSFDIREDNNKIYDRFDVGRWELRRFKIMNQIEGFAINQFTLQINIGKISPHKINPSHGHDMLAVGIKDSFVTSRLPDLQPK